MTTPLRRLSLGLLIAFAITALALGYWNVIQGEELLARADNPRRVLAERRIRRGEILDRHGVVLAQSLLDPETGFANRSYPYPDAAAVVGYYSLRYGVSGIEAAYDAFLRGEPTPGTLDALLAYLLHRPQIGGDVRLTLDLTVQRAADHALGDRRGAVVVLSVPQGEVLALSSHPTFDANRLDEDWESLRADPDAPLINRATQGLYQPGAILQSVVLAAALDLHVIEWDEVWMGTLNAEVDNERLPCARTAQGNDLASLYAAACPAPFLDIARRVGAARLDAVLVDFGLLEAPLFALPTAATDLNQLPAQSDLLLTAIGQSNLTVSPLQMALVAAAFADHGRMPPLQLVQAVRPSNGVWQMAAPTGYPRGTVSRDSADTIAELMARAAQATGIETPGVYGHAGLALAGPAQTYNAWFIGFVRRSSEEAIAAAILVEGSDDAALAARIGSEVLHAALVASP